MVSFISREEVAFAYFLSLLRSRLTPAAGRAPALPQLCSSAQSPTPRRHPSRVPADPCVRLFRTYTNAGVFSHPVSVTQHSAALFSPRFLASCLITRPTIAPLPLYEAFSLALSRGRNGQTDGGPSAAGARGMAGMRPGDPATVLQMSGHTVSSTRQSETALQQQRYRVYAGTLGSAPSGRISRIEIHKENDCGSSDRRCTPSCEG